MCSVLNSQFKPLIRIVVCDEIIKYFALLQIVKNKGKGLEKQINFLMRSRENLLALPDGIWKGTECHGLVS